MTFDKEKAREEVIKVYKWADHTPRPRKFINVVKSFFGFKIYKKRNSESISRGRVNKAERVEIMMAMYREGKSLADIGRHFGVSRERIRQYLDRNPEYHEIKCRNNKKPKPLIEKVCALPSCAKSFTALKISRKYCSDECKVKATRKYDIPEEFRKTPNDRQKWLYHNCPEWRAKYIKFQVESHKKAYQKKGKVYERLRAWHKAYRAKNKDKVNLYYQRHQAKKAREDAEKMEIARQKLREMGLIK